MPFLAIEDNFGVPVMHGHNLSHQCPISKEYGVALKSRLLQVASLPVLRKDPQPWQHLPSLDLSIDIHPISTSAFITLLKRKNAKLFGYLLLCFMQAMKASSAIWRGIADCASATISKKHQRISPLPIRNHLPLYTGAISLCTPCDIRRKVRPPCKNATVEVYHCGQAIAGCFHDRRDQPAFFDLGECMALGESKSSWCTFDIVLSSFLYNPYI